MEYLEGNPSFKITYRQSDGQSNLLSGYADSDRGNSSSRRSTSGMLMLYNKPPISWKSKMQKTTALSTAEAKYYSASTAAMEVWYLRYLMERLDFAQQKPTLHYEDNLACIEWGNNVIGCDENGPSTLTSGSTSRTKSSRTVKCSLSKSQPRPSQAGRHPDQGTTPSAEHYVCGGDPGMQEDLNS
jgi:hypothetical protein